MHQFVLYFFPRCKWLKLTHHFNDNNVFDCIGLVFDIVSTLVQRVRCVHFMIIGICSLVKCVGCFDHSIRDALDFDVIKYVVFINCAELINL